MKRKLVAAGFALALALAATSSASAQATPYIYFGGGASIGVGDFDYAKAGWIASGGVGANIGGKGLWIEAEGFYGSNKHKAPSTGDKTNLIMGFGAVGYSFLPDQKVSPYVLGGGGIMAHQYKPATGSSETSTSFAVTGAAGLGFEASPKVSVWVEVRGISSLASGAKTTLVPITAGLTINLGRDQ